MSAELLSTAEAAELLGVRPETIYSYVSRGVLQRVDATSRHEGSRFRRAEVAALRDQRMRRRGGIFEIAIETAISRADPDGRLIYRGQDACELAVSTSYESVAELLWETTDLNWKRSPAVKRSVHQTTSAAATAPCAARSRLAVALLATTAQRPEPGAVEFVSAGIDALNAAVDCLHPAPRDGTLADRLAEALLPDPTQAHRQLINAVLVLLAEHELATSTVAARVAASTGTGPFDALLAGLSAMPGRRHASVSHLAFDLLRSAGDGDARAVLAARGSDLPGFGHVVYCGVDPRARTLLDLLRPTAPETVAIAENLQLEVLRTTGLHANIDLALAAMILGLDLDPGDGEAIFTIARIAGLVAHTIEEQGHPLRFRARGTYVGPGPDVDTRFTGELAGPRDPRTQSLDE